MTFNDNTYAAFMLDHASGALSPAERVAGDLHRMLSPTGWRNAKALDALGGVLLERGLIIGAGEMTEPRSLASAPPASLDSPVRSDLERFLAGEKLVELPWRRDHFGMKTLPAGFPHASLLRLDPGERAPGHCHGRRDVTVVLTGSFADQFGVYEVGDLAFAEPGMRHEPRAVGDRPCVCLLAHEPGRPLSAFFGLVCSVLFAWRGPEQ